MTEKKMAIYAKAMNRLQPSPLLNSRVIARVNEEAESASEIVMGSSDRMLQPRDAHTRVAQTRVPQTRAVQTRVAQRTSGKPRTAGWRVSSNLVTIAASLVMVLLLTAGGYHMVLTPTTWVDVDINPSVELGLNRLNRVIDTKGINEDGVAVLEQVSLLGNKPEKAVKSIVETAARLGYMKPDQENVVALTVIADKPKQEQKLATRIRTGADQALESEGVDAEVIEQAVKPEHVEAAKALQAEGIPVSPGKLNLIGKLGEIKEQAAQHATEQAKSAGQEVKEYSAFVESEHYLDTVRDIQKEIIATRKMLKSNAGTGNGNAFGKDKDKDKEKEDVTRGINDGTSSDEDDSEDLDAMENDQDKALGDTNDGNGLDGDNDASNDDNDGNDSDEDSADGDQDTDSGDGKGRNNAPGQGRKN